jgi:hypothetical protein
MNSFTKASLELITFILQMRKLNEGARDALLPRAMNIAAE